MKSLVTMLAAAVILATMAMAIGLGLAQTPPDGKMPAAQRYLPDQEQPSPWRPDSQTGKTLYAERIVLRGENCQITIDATGRQPGILVQSTRTNDRAHVYLTPEGTPVMGIANAQRRELAVGLFADRKTGYVQVADPWGVHVLSGQELDRNRTTGALRE